MDIKRICGAVFVVMAVVVAVHTVVEPLYYTSTEESPYSPVWAVLGWVMMLPLALGVYFGYARMKAAESGGGAVTREFVAANVQFYGGFFFGIMFLLSWFAQLTPGFTAIGADTISLVWIILDAGLPLLWGAMGMFLLRGGGRK